MAIAVASLTSGSDDTDQSDYTTASISPTAGRTWLLWVCVSRAVSTDPDIPTAAGAGLTWTLHTSQLWATDATTHRRIAVFYGTGTPSSGALTLSCGTSPTGCMWDVWELTGAKTGSSPIVQAVGNFNNTAGTTGTVTLAAAANSDNRPAVAFAHNAQEATSKAAAFTEISDVTNTLPANGMDTQWRSDAFDTACSATWASSSKWGGLGIEIAVPDAATKINKLALMGVG